MPEIARLDDDGMLVAVENCHPDDHKPYTDAQIDAALVRAGVMPPQRSLQQTRTVKGGQVAAAGTIGAGAIGAIQETIGQAQEAMVGVVPYLDAAKWGLLAVTLDRHLRHALGSHR